MTNHIVVSATNATRHFSELLNKVRDQGQSFDIKRGKEIVARLVPVQPTMSARRFKEFLENLPILDVEDKEDFIKIIEETRSMKAKNPWE